MPVPQLVAFLGGAGGSPTEEAFAEALREDTLDTVERALESGAASDAILVTDWPEAAQRCPAGTRVDVDNGSFHFGERLVEVIRRYELERILYMGAGSAPLLSGDELATIGHYLGMAWNSALTNNIYSADFTAFVPGQALFKVEPPSKDNLLPRVLRDEAGLDVQELPRSMATQFNIDTPTDLAILKLVGGVGPRLNSLLEKMAIDISRYQACVRLLIDSNAQVLVAGRVGSQVWQYMERETACRVRLYAEERGMRAEGREGGAARSLLGYHVQQAGCERFFAELAEMVDGAIIDSRVLFAHMSGHPSRTDRFLSDMGRYENIEDPFLREFTEAAVKAPIPVLLGGHSLVAGGLMALTEMAWRNTPQQGS